MRNQDFKDWLQTTGIKSGAHLSNTLGVGRNQAQRAIAAAKLGEDVTVKKTFALGMTALAQGLKPWDDYNR